MREAIVSSKINQEARGKRGAVMKVKTDKTTSSILSFIQILHLKQRDILRCFKCLKFGIS